MPGEMNSANSDPLELDFFSSSSDPLIEDGDEQTEPQPPVNHYFCVYQLGSEPMQLSPFNDLHTLVSFIRDMSQKPGFRLFVFDGERLSTTRFPAPHLILKDGERIPLFDTRSAYQADDGGLIGPPAAEPKTAIIEAEPNPFIGNRRSA